jgi:hypothetical protein
VPPHASDATCSPSEATDAQYGTVDLGSARALQRLLDGGPEVPRDGDLLPPLWHWLAFSPSVTSDIRRLGGPTIGLHAGCRADRFAGGRVEWHRPVLIGQQMQRRSSVAAVIATAGGSRVRVRHEMFVSNQLCIVEECDVDCSDTDYPDPVRDANVRVDLGNADWVIQIDAGRDSFTGLAALLGRVPGSRVATGGVAVRQPSTDGLVDGAFDALLLAECCRRKTGVRSLHSLHFRRVGCGRAQPGRRTVSAIRSGRSSVLLTSSDLDGLRTMDGEAEIAR